MRKFGVEIEFSGSMDRVSQAIAAAGLGGAQHGYTGFDENLWVVKYDGSVHGGGELVSPPLDFDNEEQRGQVTRAIEAMRSAGAKPCRAAGIHVHVDTHDLTARQVAQVAKVFIRFEDILFRLASSGWQTHRGYSYCKPMSETVKQGLGKAKTEEQVKQAYFGTPDTSFIGHGHQSRYCALNLQSHYYRGTIEFRLFNSSVNAERVQMYIALAMALVQDVRNGKNRSITKSFPLGGMLAGTTDEDKAFFQFLTVVRYHADMSLADYRRVKRFWKDSKPQAAALPHETHTAR